MANLIGALKHKTSLTNKENQFVNIILLSLHILLAEEGGHVMSRQHSPFALSGCKL